MIAAGPAEPAPPEPWHRGCLVSVQHELETQETILFYVLRMAALTLVLGCATAPPRVTTSREPLEACLQSRHICGDSPKSTYREMCEERARAAYANQPDAEAREAWLARRGCYLPQRTIVRQ